jgi:hypothetical protein
MIRPQAAAGVSTNARSDYDIWRCSPGAAQVSLPSNHASMSPTVTLPGVCGRGSDRSLRASVITNRRGLGMPIAAA